VIHKVFAGDAETGRSKGGKRGDERIHWRGRKNNTLEYRRKKKESAKPGSAATRSGRLGRLLFRRPPNSSVENSISSTEKLSRERKKWGRRRMNKQTCGKRGRAEKRTVDASGEARHESAENRTPDSDPVSTSMSKRT